MLLLKKSIHLRKYLDDRRNTGEKIGFVPTMGALHTGHQSLIDKSMQSSDCTVCSIFVNPTQFNESVDLKKYPRTPEKDIDLLTGTGCHVLFLPDVDEVYPENLAVRDEFNFGYLDQPMEGTHRPGHFNGVAQVVNRLLDLVKPDLLYMGQKDFQQFCIVQNMLEQLNAKVELVMCPIVREEDGLAMSSRNVLLDGPQRRIAPVIYQTLLMAKENSLQQQPDALRETALKALNIPGLKAEYFEIVDGTTLRQIRHFKDANYVVACTAVRVGNVRLIDNMILKNN